MCFSNNSRMDTRSRYQREKCCGMKVEKPCYIFAIINVVLACLSWLGCIITLVFLLTRLAVAWFHMNFYELPFLLDVYLVYAVVCGATAIYGVFAVLLLQGIRKKRPKLIMAYLYFGLALETIMIISTTAYAGINLLATIRDVRQDRTIVCVALVLAICICILYGFILYLVRSTYLGILSRSKQNFSDELIVLHAYEDYLR